MIYSLKDAAERDSLSGTTFIQMNYMVAIWALLGELGTIIWPLGTKQVCLAGVHHLTSNLLCVLFLSAVGIGQAVIPLGFNFQRVEMISISLLFFVKGYKGQLKKAGNTRINNI
jgi:hypothetical protein